MISTTGGNFDALISTEYGILGYWPLNFNDFPSAVVTMFVLLQVARSFFFNFLKIMGMFDRMCCAPTVGKQHAHHHRRIGGGDE